MLPVAIWGHVPETAGICGPFPDVVTVVGPPSPLEPEPEPLPDPAPEPAPLEPEPPPLPLPLLFGFPPELPELLDAFVSPVPPLEEPAPFEEPSPGSPVEVPGMPFAHPTTADAPRHARTVQRTLAIELTLQSFAASTGWMLAIEGGPSSSIGAAHEGRSMRH